MSEPTKHNDKPVRPRVTFDRIEFSSGNTLHLSDDEIVVFVGPNNAGKSVALRELQRKVARPNETTFVVRSAELRWEGTPHSLTAWLEKNSIIEGNRGTHIYRGLNFAIHHSVVDTFATDHPGKDDLANIFTSRVGTDTRLNGSDPAGPLALHYQAPVHPIHLLLSDESEARRIAECFKRAFGQELIVFRAGGSAYPLLVGFEPALLPGEDRLSKRYVDELKRASVPLQDQGDGMRSFATILLHVLVASNYSIQFLDEPEAFLHPPQARLLGEYIAKSRRSNAQLFVATHSPDVLEGMLAANSAKIRIVRIQRAGSANIIKELSRSRTTAIANNPLTRYSGVLSGIFHQHVIIAESESDCLFYSAILNTKSVSGESSPDVLLIHSNGKDRMKDMAELLRELEVPVSVIADIDILSDETKLRRLFETLGGNWDEIESDWKSLSAIVSNLRPALTADQVRSRIESSLSGVAGSKPFPKEIERQIKGVFNELSPWQQIKKIGKIGFGRGEPLAKFERIANACNERDLWIVPVGELEGFCRSIEARHGPDFTEKVLAQRDIESDPDLKEARDFLTKLWNGV